MIHLTAGIDVGSSAVKAAVMRSQSGEQGTLLASTCLRIRRRHIHKVAREAFDTVLQEAGLDAEQLHYVTSTGDGEAVHHRTGHFYSMTTHARGALFLEPEAQAVIDVGALHARALRIDGRGKVLRHKMTSQCASGSGQFLENIARYLGVTLESVGELSRQAKDPESVSSICAVLAETDVINMVSRGIATEDILRGIHLSIGGRLVRLLRAIGSEGCVLVTGGLSRDTGLLGALRDRQDQIRAKTKKALQPLDFRSHPQGALAGAIGAALLGAFRYEQLKRLGRLEVIHGALAES